MNAILLGAAAGMAATVPMTMVMETLHQRLPGEPARPLPPREITEGMAVKAGVHREIDEREMQQLTLAGHVGYGAVCGAAFGLIAPRNVPGAIASGMAFGLGVWAGSYLGWLPAIGVRQSAVEDPPARSGLMIAAHLTWGAAAGAIIAGARVTTKARRDNHEGTKKEITTKARRSRRKATVRFAPVLPSVPTY